MKLKIELVVKGTTLEDIWKQALGRLAALTGVTPVKVEWLESASWEVRQCAESMDGATVLWEATIYCKPDLR